MYMNGSILDAEVSPFFDGVSVNVYDVDEKQTYQGVIVDGLAGVRELLKLRRQKGSQAGLSEDADLAQMAAQVEMPPIMQPIGLIIKRVKVNKGFMKPLLTLTRLMIRPIGCMMGGISTCAAICAKSASSERPA